MERLQKKPGSRLLLYAVLLVVTLGIMLSLRRCQNFGAKTQAPSCRDTLRVAMQFAPGSFYYDESDELAGVDYEALKDLGIPYRIFPITNPAEGLNGLDEGRYDLVVADMPQTAEMAEKYLFTDPVYFDRQVLVQRVDSVGAAPAITSPLQLDGMTVVVVKGSPMASRLKHLEREIGGDINLIERDATSERLLMELALGADSVPLVVVNGTVAEEMAKDFPRLDFSMPVSLTQYQPWILSRSKTALRDTINSRLSRRQSD